VTRLALVAFLGHAPGLWLFAGYRLTTPFHRYNVAALMMTAAVSAALAAFSLRGALIAWMVGHFAWSTLLAWGVARGVAGEMSTASPPRS